MTDKPKGMQCPNCGEPCVNLATMQQRLCATGCKQTHPWPLDKGQIPLVSNNRQKPVK